MEGQQQANQPGGEGKGGKAGQQPGGAPRELPPELAKLGLSPADWVKLRSTLTGTGSADSVQVPAEYRRLMQDYFGALRRGEPVGEENRER